MSSLLLAPYNDSMRLGQGYNSFLQIPCLGNAVEIEDNLLDKPNGSLSTAQSVAYSSSFVDKMSELVRTMNISAGSSIMTGSVNASGGGVTVDETKFTESDINMILSVKVVNQTRKILDRVIFKPYDGVAMDRFHEFYGDCFISGFIEGGDLHGIVSVRALESSKRAGVKSSLQSAFNSASQDFAPQSSSSPLSEALRSSETTVTVNWSGGGMIKDGSEEWTLDALMRAAAAFPDNVSKCPQRTYAILTRYDTVPSFVQFAAKNGVEVKRFEGVQRYTSELLDMYVEYKSNLLIVNDAIKTPSKYQSSETTDSVSINVASLVVERKKLKREMLKIVDQIEKLNETPASASHIQNESDIVDPELWRIRLPIRVGKNPANAAESHVAELMQSLPIASAQDAVAIAARKAIADESGIEQDKVLASLRLELVKAQKSDEAKQGTIDEQKTRIQELEEGKLRLEQDMEIKYTRKKVLGSLRLESFGVEQDAPTDALLDIAGGTSEFMEGEEVKNYLVPVWVDCEATDAITSIETVISDSKNDDYATDFAQGCRGGFLYLIEHRDKANVEKIAQMAIWKSRSRLTKHDAKKRGWRDISEDLGGGRKGRFVHIVWK